MIAINNLVTGGVIDGSLKGDNLGTVAFEVLAVNQLFGFPSGSLPEVEIQILDAEQVCAGELELFTDAPSPSPPRNPLMWCHNPKRVT